MISNTILFFPLILKEKGERRKENDFSLFTFHLTHTLKLRTSLFTSTKVATQQCTLNSATLKQEACYV
jgi:hypothetical protein